MRCGSSPRIVIGLLATVLLSFGYTARMPGEEKEEGGFETVCGV